MKAFIPTLKRHHGHATDLTQRALSLALSQQGGSQRNIAMILVSCGAGLRAKEIASLTWSMVLSEEGTVGNVLTLPDHAAKNGSGGSIPLAKNVAAALEALRLHTAKKTVLPSDPVFISQKGGRAITRQGVVDLFRRIWMKAGIAASSHSGRRWFATCAARSVSTVGGSLRDVQMLMRHSSLQTTQMYICPNTKAQRDLVDIVGKGLRVI
jgi:integrase